MNRKYILPGLLALSACTLQAQDFQSLDANDLRVGFSSYGLNFCQLDQTGQFLIQGFEVPKDSNIHSASMGAFWVGGRDANNTIRIAAQTYGQSGPEYSPGPFSSTNNYINANTWYHVWKINSAEIQAFQNWHANPSAYPNYTIPNDILTWPGNGNTALGHAAQLAPYNDVNNDGQYNTADGDYPCIKGNQAIFYIMNEADHPHSSTGSLRIGIEVHCMAYTYDPALPLGGVASNTLDHTVIVDYKFFNRGTVTLHDAYLGTWDDLDLGFYNDDYIGSDVANNMYYIYNGDGYDETGGGVNGYKSYPPALGIKYLKTPLADAGDGIDNDRDGVIDESGEELGLSGFYDQFNNASNIPAGMTLPSNATEYYNYLQGKWKDGTPFTCDASSGYGGTTPTHYLFPDNTYANSPCGTAPWTEASSSNVPGDRRGLGSTGPFTFQAGEMRELEIAYIWQRSSSLNNPLQSVADLQTAAPLVLNHYLLQNTSCMNFLPSGIQEISSIRMSIYPVPASDLLNVSLPYTIQQLEVLDLLGNTVLTQVSPSKSLNIQGLSEGVYLLKASTAQGVATQRFIKQ